MSLWLIEGFDIKWFKPGLDNSLVPIVPKWGLPIVPFAMEPTSANLLQLQPNSGTIRAPMNVATKLPFMSPLDVIVGARFYRTGASPALLCSVWEGKPTETGSRLIGGVMVASDGSMVGFQGGSWNRDAVGWGLSEHTNFVSTPDFTFPYKEPQPHLGNFWEAHLVLNAAGQLTIELRAYDDSDQLEFDSLASGTITVSPPPNMNNLYLWVFSNYSYKDASGNLIPMHALDDLYLVLVDGIYPSSPIGPIIVDTLLPVRATVMEWNVTGAGHVEAVRDGWVSHPANDPEYIWTNAANRRELWKIDTPIYEPEPVLVGIQMTAWVNFQTLPPSKLALLTRWEGSEVAWQPQVGVQSDVTGVFGYITRVLLPFVSFNQLRDVEWGVQTVP